MGKPFHGSIDFTELMAAAKAAHSAFSRSEKNQHVYGKVTLWVNDEPDKFGNTMSIQLNPAQNSPDKKLYFGNFKGDLPKANPQYAHPVDMNSVPDDDDLPF